MTTKACPSILVEALLLISFVMMLRDCGPMRLSARAIWHRFAMVMCAGFMVRRKEVRSKRSSGTPSTYLYSKLTARKAQLKKMLEYHSMKCLF